MDEQQLLRQLITALMESGLTTTQQIAAAAKLLRAVKLVAEAEIARAEEA